MRDLRNASNDGCFVALKRKGLKDFGLYFLTASNITTYRS